MIPVDGVALNLNLVRFLLVMRCSQSYIDLEQRTTAGWQNYVLQTLFFNRVSYKPNGSWVKVAWFSWYNHDSFLHFMCCIQRVGRQLRYVVAVVVHIYVTALSEVTLSITRSFQKTSLKTNLFWAQFLHSDEADSLQFWKKVLLCSCLCLY